jgi:hypothetical protein
VATVNDYDVKLIKVQGNFDAALGRELLDIAVGQAEAQVPVDGVDDHAGWEAGPAKTDRVTGAAQGRRVLMLAVSLLERGHSQCNSALEDRTASWSPRARGSPSATIRY